MNDKELSDYNSIDAWSAIQKMQSELGWKLFMRRYAKEGDEILTQLLDVNLDNNGHSYTKRDLLAYQLEALGKIGKVLNELEIEAKNASLAQKEKKHVGN